MKKIKRKTIIIILISIILLFFIGLYLYFENNYLQVSIYTVESSKIPKDFTGFKIVQISDFHNTKFKKLTNDIIKEIKNSNPNIIVITGDLIDAYKTNIDIAISFVEKINDIAPIYYVTGNHEARIENYEEFKNKLEENKVTILDDKLEVIKKDNSEINLIGIDDPSFNFNTYSDDSTIVEDNLTSIQFDKNKFNILLSHRPELIDTYAKNNFDLVLTGHAHGGQIRIPFIGGLIAPNQGLFPKYTSGAYEMGNTKMIVSRGIGNSILPFRINNRPELVVIELKNK